MSPVQAHSPSATSLTPLIITPLHDSHDEGCIWEHSDRDVVKKLLDGGVPLNLDHTRNQRVF